MLHIYKDSQRQGWRWSGTLLTLNDYFLIKGDERKRNYSEVKNTFFGCQAG
jgi:hypothetical protein